MGQEEIVTDVWVICKTCGEKHQLKRGIDAPVYWCGNDLRKLEDGDDIEYNEIDPLDEETGDIYIYPVMLEGEKQWQ